MSNEQAPQPSINQALSEQDTIIEDLTVQLNAAIKDLGLRTEQAETQSKVLAQYKEDIEQLNAKLNESQEAIVSLSVRLETAVEQRNEASDRLLLAITDVKSLSAAIQRMQQEAAQAATQDAANEPED